MKSFRITQLTSFLCFAALLAAVAFSSCKKEQSEDPALEPVKTATLCVGTNSGTVFGYNPSDGVKKWELNVGDMVGDAPLFFNNQFYVAEKQGVLISINPNTGAQMKARIFLGGLGGAPVGDGSLIYVPCLNDTLYAIDPNTLETKWKGATKGDLVTSPVVYNDRVIVASDDSAIYAFDKIYGKQIWRYKSGFTAKFKSSPAVQSKFIYIGAQNGTFLALDTAGKFAWGYPLTQPIESSPILYGGNVIFGATDNKLYCVDTQAHRPRWIFNAKDRIVSSALALDQVIYVGSYDYRLYALNIIDGSIKWQFITGAAITSSPVHYRGRIYLSGLDNQLYALDTAHGDKAWQQTLNGSIQSSPVIGEDGGAGFHPSVSGMTQ